MQPWLKTIPDHCPDVRALNLGRWVNYLQAEVATDKTTFYIVISLDPDIFQIFIRSFVLSKLLLIII